MITKSAQDSCTWYNGTLPCPDAFLHVIYFIFNAVFSSACLLVCRLKMYAAQFHFGSHHSGMQTFSSAWCKTCKWNRIGVFAQHKYPWDESFLLLDRHFPPNSYSTRSVFIITYNTHKKRNLFTYGVNYLEPTLKLLPTKQ